MAHSHIPKLIIYNGCAFSVSKPNIISNKCKLVGPEKDLRRNRITLQ